jgi:hypothetical protein
VGRHHHGTMKCFLFRTLMHAQGSHFCGSHILVTHLFFCIVRSKFGNTKNTHSQKQHHNTEQVRINIYHTLER